MTIAINDLRYSDRNGTRIDMSVTRDGETFPFTYSPTDPADLAVVIKDMLQDGNYEIAPYVEPAPIVPASVSAMQARVALLRAGLLDAVETWVSGQNTETKLVWGSASTFNRGSEMIAGAASALGLSDAQVDALFTAAAEINP